MLGYLISLRLTLQEIAKLFSKEAMEFCIPISNVTDFQLLHILFNMVLSGFSRLSFQSF